MASTKPPRALLRQKPVRRPRHRFTPVRQRINWRRRAVLGSSALVLVLLGWAVAARRFAPTANTPLSRFDVIVVLGSPTDSDGNPTPRQLARVLEGVREYERDIAPRLIMTGGAVHNRFGEAQAMARTAEAEGIPQSAIFVEPHAEDTVQNACYAVGIMKAHGWRSAEVVSDAVQLPRAAMIFDRLPLDWRTHAAPLLAPRLPVLSAADSVIETIKTVRYLVYASWADRCQP